MYSNGVDSVLEKRIKQLQRAFRRELHSTKSTTIQQALIERAARLTAIAEAMVNDPDCKPSHLVLMDNRAQAARVEMFTSFGKPVTKRLTLAAIRQAGAHARPSKASIAKAAHDAMQAALHRTREAAAKEIGCEASDWRAIRLAALVSAHEQLQTALASGERVSFSELLDVDRALGEMRKELKLAQPLNVQVKIVHPRTKCPQCQHEFSLDLPDDDSSGSPVQAASSKPVAQPADPTPSKAPGSIVAAVPGSAAMSRPAAPKVVELKRPSIHDPVVFGDGTKLNPPLKRLGPYPLPTV
jgi:hypothetical protein